MTRSRRVALLATGHLCVALAAAGAFLPIVPSTPFVLAAAACYVRASERHHRWLLANRVLGPLLRDMVDRGGMRAHTKALALLMVWASLAVCAAGRTQHPVALAVIACAGVAATAAILRVRTLRSPRASKDAP